MLNGKCPHCGGEVREGICLYCDSDVRESSDKIIENIANMEKNMKAAREAINESEAARRKRNAVITTLAAAVFIIFALAVFVSLTVDRYNSRRNAYSREAGSGLQMSSAGEKNAGGSSADNSSSDDAEAAGDSNSINIKEISAEKGRWSEGTYKIGEDIPYGTYLLMYDGLPQGYSDFPVGLYEDAAASDDRDLTADTWSRFSRYITVKDKAYLKVSHSVMYDIDKNDVVNDPYEHGGMFLVGRDIEPGKYSLTFDSRFEELDPHQARGSYKIYSDVDIVAPVMVSQGQFKEGVTLTVEKGQFLKLDECKIDKKAVGDDSLTANGTGNSEKNITDVKNELFAQKGRWSEGTYKIGEDIPYGTYLVMYDCPSPDDTSRDFHVQYIENSEMLGKKALSAESYSTFSRYITLKDEGDDEGYIDVSWAVIYDPDKNDIKNDPHDHCGMFLVGRDVAPGTYELAFDEHYAKYNKQRTGEYIIYSDVDAVTPVVKERGELEDGITVTVSEGEFLKLDKCVIR